MLQVIKKIIVLAIVLLGAQLSAQEYKPNDSVQAATFVEQQKALMKKEIAEINQSLEEGLISIETAALEKEKIALRYAAKLYNNAKKSYKLTIGGENVIFKDKKHTPKKDRRTYSDIVIAFGLNSTLKKGQSINDSEYKAAGSRFFEMGVAWRTRVFKNHNWLRVKYGVSLQYNNLKPKDNKYFVKSGNITTLEVHEFDLKKSKLRMTNLVMPIHFEFGPSTKKEKANYFRYSTKKKLKIGLGGYAGLRIGTRQKLKYEVDGDMEKHKDKSDFNANDFVYGLSGYFSFGGVGLYAKYDLNPLFSNPNEKQNNVSLGVRFDMD